MHVLKALPQYKREIISADVGNGTCVTAIQVLGQLKIADFE